MNRIFQRVLHIYEHDAASFERLINEAISRVIEGGGAVDEIRYAIDPSTRENLRGGFGALLLCTVERPLDDESDDDDD